jgi:hypothetical protein
MANVHRDARILRRLMAGASLREVGAEFDLSYEAIRVIGNRLGFVNPRGFGYANPLTPEEIDSALQLHNRGLRPAHVAQSIGRTPRTVADLLCKRGLREKEEPPPTWNEDDTRYVRRWYGRKSARAIAQHLGRNRNEIIGKARRLGLCKPLYQRSVDRTTASESATCA